MKLQVFGDLAPEALECGSNGAIMKDSGTAPSRCLQDVVCAVQVHDGRVRTTKRYTLYFS